MSAVLGFDIDNIDDATQADHLAQAKQAVTNLASTLGADILDASGQPDPGKAQQLVNVALDVRDITLLPLTPRSALESLQQTLQRVPGAKLPSRRKAMQALDRHLLSLDRNNAASVQDLLRDDP